MADYYDLLGVARDVDADSLKRAYRRLARQYHPDINKEAGAEDKFKEIGRAYEVLSDPQTRARYDQFGEAGLGGGGGSPDMGDMGGFADLFETFFSGFGGGGAATGGGGRRRSGPRQGDDLRLDLNLDFRDAVFGVEKEVQLRHLESCGTCKGSGAKEGSGPTTCGTCSGAGQVRRATRTPFGSFTQVAPCPTCEGSGQVIADPCGSCNGAGLQQVSKTLRINIPAGVGMTPRSIRRFRSVTSRPSSATPLRWRPSMGLSPSRFPLAPSQAPCSPSRTRGCRGWAIRWPGAIISSPSRCSCRRGSAVMNGRCSGSWPVITAARVSGCTTRVACSAGCSARDEQPCTAAA